MKSLSCFLVLGAVVSVPALAEQMTVGDLARFCTSSDAGDKAACRFYILGVTEGTSLAANSVQDAAGTFHEVKGKPLCVPEDLSGAALELVVKLSIGEDLMVFPQDRDLAAVSFVSVVVRQKFSVRN